MNKTQTLSENNFKNLREHDRYCVLCVYCCAEVFLLM